MNTHTETIPVTRIPSPLAVFYEYSKVECLSCGSDVELIRQRTIPDYKGESPFLIPGDEMQVRCPACGESFVFVFEFEKSGDGPPVRLVELALKRLLEINAKRAPYPSCSGFNKDLGELFEAIDQEDELSLDQPASSESGTVDNLRTETFRMIARAIAETYAKIGSPIRVAPGAETAAKYFKMLAQSLRSLPRPEVERLVKPELRPEILRFILV